MVGGLTKAAAFENPTYSEHNGNGAEPSDIDGYLDVERNVGTSVDEEE